MIALDARRALSVADLVAVPRVRPLALRLPTVAWEVALKALAFAAGVLCAASAWGL
jgi:hypothetical protein